MCTYLFRSSQCYRSHPQGTFIDKRDYKTYFDLYEYLKNISDEQYFQFLINIKNFIKSDCIKEFSLEYFADTIIREIFKDIN